MIRHLGEKAVAPLRDALEYDGDHDRRSIAGAALGALGEEHSLEILLEALTSEDPSLRIAAVAGLDGLDSGRVVEPLIGALRDPSVGVRELAAMSLGEVNDSRAVEPLIGALEGDPDPSVRRAAAESLSFLGRPRAAEALRRVASRGLEEDAFVRDIVAHALWRLEYLERLNGG